MSIAARAVIRAAMGMDKSGTQVLTAGVWTKLTSWTVRSGFPDTVITNDALVMNGNDASVTFSFMGTFTAVLGTQQFQVYKNGTAQGSAVNAATASTVTFGVAVGDTVELWAYAGAAFARTVQTGSTATYLYAS